MKKKKRNEKEKGDRWKTSTHPYIPFLLLRQMNAHSCPRWCSTCTYSYNCAMCCRIGWVCLLGLALFPLPLLSFLLVSFLFFSSLLFLLLFGVCGGLR
ncbi:hypothetical protein HDK64DRAFT_88 [Phyllosticta capitalensis]